MQKLVRPISAFEVPPAGPGLPPLLRARSGRQAAVRVRTYGRRVHLAQLSAYC